MKELIDFLEKKGFKGQADDLRNGGITLNFLNIGYSTNIEDEGVKLIANALKFNSTIISLNLLCNGIRDEGVVALADALKSNKSLRYLDLGANKIGVEGAKFIADALKSNKSLRYLNLGGNEIGDEGAKFIVDALKSNKSLRYLNLGGNEIGDGVVKLIADVLKSNLTLTHLELENNNIGYITKYTTLKTINTYLQRNKVQKAESLNAEGNNLCIQEKYSEAIEKYEQAIKLNEKPLYKANKIQAERVYGEQILTFKQLIIEIENYQTQNAENLINRLNTNILSKIDDNGETALTWAAFKGLEKACEMLIPKMSEQAINHVGNAGETALTLAAFKGLEKACEMLIPKMSEQAINQVTNNGETALTWAAFKGLEKACEMLIPKMSEQAINHVNNAGETALTWAALKGLEKACEMLIPKMSEQAINQVTNNDETALTLAALKELEKVCEMLIPKMSEQAINQVTNNGETALTLAALKELEKVCEMLIPKMSEQAINQVTNNGETALTLAALIGLEKVCEMLIPKMSEQAINQVTNNDETALTLALIGLEKVCEMLIPKMSEQAINHVNKDGETALSLATDQGFKNIRDLLTNKKVNLANKAATEKKQEKQQQSLKLDELKYNQLISAIRDNKAAEAEKLVKELNGDTLSKIDDNGETALTLAASKGLSKVCLQLIPLMSDPAINTITKTYGTTALTCAAWKGLSEVCVQLISRMPDQTINHITNGGDTALTLAVWNGLEKVSELLIPRMTIQAIHHVNNKGETVLSLVIKNNFKKIYDLLTLRVNELNNQINKTNIYKNEEEKLIIEEEEDIYQIIGKIIFNLQDSTNIDEADKPIIENTLYRILNKVQKLTDKNDIIDLTQRTKKLIKEEITEGKVVDLEDEVNEMVENIRIQKLNIFNEIVTKIITKLETANVKDSVVIQAQINEIASKVQTSENNTSIEQITNWMKELIDSKITRGTVIDLRKKIDTIILQEINESTNVITFAVKEIIYYNPLLNHPKKLLQTALDSKLSPDLIYDAITNNDEELILAGLMSLEIYTPPAG